MKKRFRAGKARILVFITVRRILLVDLAVFMCSESSGFRAVAARLVKQRWFDHLTIALILSNMVFMGILTDYGGEGEYAERLDSGTAFGVINFMYAILFSVEIGVRMLAYPSMKAYLFDSKNWMWNWLDLVFLVILDVETWIFPYVIPDAYTHTTRPLRLLRCLRVLRVFNLVKSLRSLMRAVGASVSACTALLVFQLILIYSMAVIYVNWVRSTPSLMENEAIADEFYDYFGTTYRAMLTFFQILIVDDAFAVTRFTFDNAVWIMGTLLLVYLALSTWLLYNVLIGLICQVVFENTEKDLETNAEEAINDWLKPYPDTMTRPQWDSAIKSLESTRTVLDSEKLETARVLAQTDNSEIPRNKIAETYVKLLKPIQAVDILACQTELETLYARLEQYHPRLNS